MKEAYRAVAGRIRRDLEDVAEIVERVETIWARYESNEDPFYVDAAALNLHDVYAGLERLFEAIARRIDQSVPDGPRWHEDLLDQMASDIPSTRPAVFSSDTRRRLDPYRGFRHVVRNVYTIDFDPDQMRPLVRRLPDVHGDVEDELLEFADTLEHIAEDKES
jgi:hypothetical protein